MHFKSIILTLAVISVLCHTLAALDYPDASADSVYQRLSAADRLSQIVLERSEGESAIPTSSAIYIDHPLGELHDFDNQFVVVALDDRMNPFDTPELELPDLLTLASIANESLLKKYFTYFEKFCKQAGIDKVVLPVVDQYSRTAQITASMNAHDPSFFVERNRFSFQAPAKKKEFIETFENADFLVIEDFEYPQVMKKLSRYADKVLTKVDCSESIKISMLGQAKSSAGYFFTKLPNQLSVGIARGSVIPLQKEIGILPLKTDSLCLITNQPYGSLANMLRKYTYVMTTHQDIAQSNAPILIDNNAAILEDVLSEDRLIVFAGQMQGLIGNLSYVDAALLYRSESVIYNYTLPQQLFGTTGINGLIPVNYPMLAIFSNVAVVSQSILGHAPSFMVGLDQSTIRKIEDIMQEAIQSGSTPGAQLALAVDGSIVFDEAYGYLTYDSLIATQKNTLYDLASLTKVTSTLLAVMKLYENGAIDLDAPIGKWLPEYATSNKKEVTIRALLAHNAGLISYVPFWKRALSADLMEPFSYDSEENEKADIRSYGSKPTTALRDTLEHWILNSPLLRFDSIPYYKYSDLGFMILHQVIESVTGEPMEEYLNRNFYSPMGLTRMVFNPLAHGIERFEIAPTEFDYYFRNELVWGEVHDRNASIFGGVAGHAGLFANAHDLVVVLQTLLQGGSYRGQTFLQPETINYFNQKFYPDNRRALGWDKLDKDLGNASPFSSEAGFGHTGFTGTMVWCDPAYDLVFVFLSNRIHPNANNWRLVERDIRTRIQDVVYEALLAKWVK